jgi:hypothetical protein
MIKPHLIRIWSRWIWNPMLYPLIQSPHRKLNFPIIFTKLQNRFLLRFHKTVSVMIEELITLAQNPNKFKNCEFIIYQNIYRCLLFPLGQIKAALHKTVYLNLYKLIYLVYIQLKSSLRLDNILKEYICLWCSGTGQYVKNVSTKEVLKAKRK